MVAPSPRTRRPPPRPQPRGLPPTARRRPPPPYAYGPPPRHHGGRRFLVLVLVLATLGAGGYLYLSRGGSSSAPTGFVGANQESVKAIDTVVAAAQPVQRFTELHAFDVVATAQSQVLAKQLTTLQSVSTAASGRQKQIADEAIATISQAIDAVGRYRKAVAFTYRLTDAESAHQDLSSAVASLKQEAQAWQHS